ncbi:MlaD family protein [Myroides ceti]|uniref:MlaD family protein n=1 Tax=Paenimyroides ceti TaxID=395087 RepID=A0ABT8CS72_9FLAO|nr:MlaD family protein [Paenimyroides ceti]MDN3706626.1 MlaD family protein [Paenimyroides ceti]
MKLSKELKTAILVLTSIALVLWGYNFLKGKNIFDTSRKFYVEYDNVEGLSTASTVTINGLTVGKVSKITILDSGKLLVEILMTNHVEIPKSTKAVIYAPGFIGGKQIALETDFADKEYAKDGDFLIPQAKVGMLDGLGEKVDPVMQKLDSVLLNVNKVVVSINNVLDPQSQQNLKAALADLNETMKNAKGITGKFDRIVDTNTGKINSIVSEFGQTSQNLNKLSNNLSQADIDGILKKFDAAATNLDQLIAGIENGQGNLGKLLKDEALYNNLNKASKEMSQLLEDVKLNPKRYIHLSVFGKNPGPYVAPKSTE